MLWGHDRSGFCDPEVYQTQRLDLRLAVLFGATFRLRDFACERSDPETFFTFFGVFLFFNSSPAIRATFFDVVT
jgi:hypothetical protein